MTCEVAVIDLVARHADCLNVYQPEAFGRNFVEDGVWDIDGVARAEGRDDIQALMERLRGSFDWVVQGVQGTRLLEADAQSARARSYVVEYGRLRGEGHFLFGCYHDHCVLQDGAWYFKLRRFTPIYMGRNALDIPPVNYPAPNYFAVK